MTTMGDALLAELRDLGVHVELCTKACCLGRAHLDPAVIPRLPRALLECVLVFGQSLDLALARELAAQDALAVATAIAERCRLIADCRPQPKRMIQLEFDFVGNRA